MTVAIIIKCKLEKRIGSLWQEDQGLGEVYSKWTKGCSYISLPAQRTSNFPYY